MTVDIFSFASGDGARFTGSLSSKAQQIESIIQVRSRELFHDLDLVSKSLNLRSLLDGLFLQATKE